jgi:catechol 2,3-dioxygenase-like lactoylglutathione lyase family enzyme
MTQRGLWAAFFFAGKKHGLIRYRLGKRFGAPLFDLRCQNGKQSGGDMELKIDKVIETVLYVSDIERADAFYREVLKLPTMAANERFRAYNVGDRSVLLLFIEGDSLRGAHYPTGFIPAHDGVGPAHIGLAVTKEQLPHWERHLVDNGMEIEGRMRWEHGGESIYFRDPDAHLLELVTPGIWANY